LKMADILAFRSFRLWKTIDKFEQGCCYLWKAYISQPNRFNKDWDHQISNSYNEMFEELHSKILVGDKNLL
jgi:hypothetical protein